MFIFGEQGDATDEICIQFYNPGKKKKQGIEKDDGTYQRREYRY